MEKSNLTQTSFDDLLRWLDSDRERAGERYEDIRSRLIHFFAFHGADSAEDLADETINRVASKVQHLAEQYTGNPALYFYGVAKKVHLEYLRRQRPVILPTEAYSSREEADEGIYDCLERCLEQLSPNQRELLIAYYREDKEGKLAKRKELTRKLGVQYNALRVRVFRLRSHLEKCVRTCLEQK